MPVRSPTRVTMKVNAVVPALPSFRLIWSALIDSVDGSSFKIVACATDWPTVGYPGPSQTGLYRMTSNASLGSTTASPATFTVIVAVFWPTAKET